MPVVQKKKIEVGFPGNLAGPQILYQQETRQLFKLGPGDVLFLLFFFFFFFFFFFVLFNSFDVTRDFAIQFS